MSNRKLWTVVGLFLALFLVALTTGCDGAILNLRMSYQGRLTDSLGNPINGPRNMTFRLWDSATTGTNMWEETQNNVPVNNGLFNVSLGAVTPLDPGDFHRPLWLEVTVAGQLMGDRQPLQGAPYALSLAPGAVVKGNGTTGTYTSTLTLSNVGPGNALLLYAANGPGVLSFGNPAVYANGSIQSSALTYWWISGNSLVKNVASDSTRWDMQINGAARVWRGATAGSKIIYYPVTMPSQLYGQVVKVTKLTVYYKCLDGTKGFISGTTFNKQTDADSSLAIVNDTTNRISNAAAEYTLNLTTNNTLSATQGGLSLWFTLSFADDTNYVQIGAIRLELEHD